MSLRYKLIILVISIVSLVAIANYYSTHWVFESLQEERLKSAEVVFGKSLAQRLFRKVVEENVDKITALLFDEKMLRETKVEYILVFDQKGYLLAHTYLYAMPRILLTLNNAFSESETFRIDKIKNKEVQVYDIAIPIMEGIKQVGTLHVGIKADYLAKIITPTKRAGMLSLIIIFLLAGIVIVIAIVASNMLTESLRKLQRQAVQISKGNMDEQVNVGTKDEIGALAKALEKMRRAVKESQQQLEGINIDLEKKVAERTQELKESERQLNNMLASISHPLYAINVTDYSVNLMNPAAKKMNADITAEKVTCYHLSHHRESPCDPEECPCPLKIVQETKKPVVVEHVHYDENGTEQDIEVYGFPIFNDEGAVVQVVESNIDITDRRNAEKARLLLERELSQAQKLKSIGTLAAGIAHEINTPIQFIANNTQFLQKGIKSVLSLIEKYRTLLSSCEPGEKTEYAKREAQENERTAKLPFLEKEMPRALDQSQEGIDRVASIVSAMRDFSHMGSGEKVKEDINKAIESTVTISRNEWKYVAEMKTELASDLPLVVCMIGDIKQVILNLIVNASHAIADVSAGDESKKGLITVRTYAKEKSVFITVSDTGTGIPEGIRNKVFDHFFTTKKVGKGTGQGLSMAYQTITEKHGGKISFETEEGKGTTFIIELPIEDKNKKEHTQEG